MPLERLARQFERYPGIGSKTALRLAFYTLELDRAQVDEFADALRDARERIGFCKICGFYSDGDVCEICSNPRRTSETLCVVKDARDILALERSGEFTGRYHVLGGVISPMDGVGPDDIRIRELIERVGTEGVKEIILATNPDMEGDATASYIAAELKPLGVKTTRIAHGVPVGGNLEFIDSLTLMKALEGRREF